LRRAYTVGERAGGASPAFKERIVIISIGTRASVGFSESSLVIPIVK
jgi:hypothetical protein